MHRGRWGGRDSYDTAVTVLLPPGMHPGAVIGVGASNIKLISARCGRRVWLEVQETGQVVIKGERDCVKQAKAMLEAQIEAFVESGGSYPHAQKMLHLVTGSLAASLGDAVMFRRCQDAVAAATDRRQRGGARYELVPAGDRGAPDDALAAGMAGLSLGKAKLSLFLPAQQDALLSAFISQLQLAGQHSPPLHELKLRFSLGKQLFYAGRERPTVWGAQPPSEGRVVSLRELQAMEPGKELGIVFSNCVLPAQLDTLRAFLTDELGFRDAGRKETVTVTLMHLGLNSAYHLSLINKDGLLLLRKAKTANIKPAFLPVLAGSGRPDLRIKALAQHHFRAGSATSKLLAEVAASARVVPGPGRPRVAFDFDLAAEDLKLELERHKSKELLQGCFRAPGSAASTELKLTLQRVVTASGAWHEVAGASPELNDLLADLLAAGGALTARREGELREHLANLVAFAEAAGEALAGAEL